MNTCNCLFLWLGNFKSVSLPSRSKRALIYLAWTTLLFLHLRRVGKDVLKENFNEYVAHVNDIMAYILLGILSMIVVAVLIYCALRLLRCDTFGLTNGIIKKNSEFWDYLSRHPFDVIISTPLNFTTMYILVWLFIGSFKVIIDKGF